LSFLFFPAIIILFILLISYSSRNKNNGIG